MNAKDAGTGTSHGMADAGAHGLRREPVRGRTYCLYGPSADTRVFYETVYRLADDLLVTWPDLEKLLESVRQASRKKSGLRGLAAPRLASSGEAALALVRERLAPYVGDVEAHLRSLSIAQRRDEEVAASRDQYLLYCLEAELTNRLHIADFKRCPTKLAFLPHCISMKDDGCRRKFDGFDYACTSCEPDCYMNAVSRLLREHDVAPYIWEEADLSEVLREGVGKPGGLGVLGIACLPELVSGMRKCERAGAPVVGIPLDGNCCRRWWGVRNDNTVDLDALERLLSG